MKLIKTYLPLLWMLLMLIPTSSVCAQKECRCHSKQPAMKRMHEIIGFKNCGDCHSKNEDLMSGKSANAAKKDFSQRFKEDRFCLPCHDSDGAVKKDPSAAIQKIGISGTLFCPKDKARFPAGTKACAKCGGNLINIDESMERSRKSPSNGICMECHPMEEVGNIKRHRIFNAQKLQRCLDCHQGHDDCGSCHH
jgi:hypothetical protein